MERPTLTPWPFPDLPDERALEKVFRERERGV
jgi:hypothetical protein